MNNPDQKPIPLPVVPENIPEELKARDQWVLWGYQWSETKQKWDKPPIRVSDISRGASVTDPETWSDFEIARKVYQLARLGGLGYVLTEIDEMTGVDMDNVYDPVQQKIIVPEAQQIVEALNSYTEVSPSGTGLRIFVRGKLPPGGRKKAFGTWALEIYDTRRYLTITGAHLLGAPKTIETRDTELQMIHNRFFPAKPKTAVAADHRSPVLTDAAILAHCRTAKNSPKFIKLYDEGDTADYAGDDSRADAALVSLIAWYTQDPEQIDRVFRGSKIVRDKWTDDNPYYRDRTMAFVLEGLDSVYEHEPLIEVVDASKIDAIDLAFPESVIIGLGRRFTDLYSEHFEAPRAFWYMAFLTFFGAWISKKVSLDSGLEVWPRLYTALLGISGWTRKSSAMDHTEDFFTRVQDALYGQQIDPQVMAQAGVVLTLWGSGSAEAIAKRIMTDQKRPVLMKFDELKMLLDKGRQDNSQLLPLLTAVWGKGRWSNDTLKDGSTTLTEAAVSLLAACTLGTFESMFKGTEADIGLLNRLWVVPASLDKVIPVPTSVDEDALIQLVTDVGQTIRALTGGAGTRVLFAPQARVLWNTWYTDFRRRAESSEIGARIDSYGLRFCVLLAASEKLPVSGEPLVIREPVVEAVIELLEWQLKVRAQFYPILADNQTAAMEEKIRKTLARKPGQWFSRWTLSKLVNARRTGTGVFDKALDGLKANAEIEVRSEIHKYSKTTARWYRSRAA